MPSKQYTRADRERDFGLLRYATAGKANHLAIQVALLAAIYSFWPNARVLLAYVGNHAERVRHDLAILIAAEQRLTVAS